MRSPPWARATHLSFLGFPAIELLEDLRLFLGGDAAAVVLNADIDIMLLRLQIDPNTERPFRDRRLERIVQQIHDDLLDAQGIPAGN